MRVLGIDPGMSGGCAIFCANATVPTPPDGIIDMPITGEDSLKRVDYVALRDWIYAMQPTHVVIERVWAQPMMPGRSKGNDAAAAAGWGAKVNFTLGGAFHAACAVVVCLGHEPELAPKTRWSKMYPRLQRTGKDDDRDMKEEARLLAIEDEPAIEPFLKRKKDHGRAEAWLIARWRADQLMRQEDENIGQRVGKKARRLR